MPATVINGPPERNRTRSPLRNGGAAELWIAVFDGAGAEKAGDKGTLSVTPSVTAIATDTCFVHANILNSILELCGLFTAARATWPLQQRLVSRGLERACTIHVSEP